MSIREIQLEDWAWEALDSEAERNGVGVSVLIREAVAEKYLPSSTQRVEAFRQWKGPWADRDDIGDAVEYVRKLREDDRIKRLYTE
jgi:hypothetical protein